MQADQLNSFAEVLAAKFAEQVKGLLPQPTQLMDEDLRGQNGDDADGADDTEDVLEWTSIIPTRLVEATTEDGKKLVRLCQKSTSNPRPQSVAREHRPLHWRTRSSPSKKTSGGPTTLSD